jgi:broad specificity phosphatase PhoE
MNISIIRHGQTNWNTENLFQGMSNIPLNSTGIEQAKKLALDLKDEKIDIIFSSPLDRAIKTAQFINEYHHSPLIIDSHIIERNLGDLEGTKMFDYDIPNLFDNILNLSKLNSSIYNVETLNDIITRALYFLNKVISEYSNSNKNIYVVAHGSINLILLLLLGEVDISKPLVQFHIENCCCYTIENPTIKFIP